MVDLTVAEAVGGEMDVAVETAIALTAPHVKIAQHAVARAVAKLANAIAWHKVTRCKGSKANPVKTSNAQRAAMAAWAAMTVTASAQSVPNVAVRMVNATEPNATRKAKVNSAMMVGAIAMNVVENAVHRVMRRPSILSLTVTPHLSKSR